MSFDHLYIRDVEGERRIKAADLPLRIGTGNDCNLRLPGPGGGPVILLDIRGSNPAEYITRVLDPWVLPIYNSQRIKGVRLLAHTSKTELEPRRANAAEWDSAIRDWAAKTGVPIVCRYGLHDHFAGLPCLAWASNICDAFSQTPGVDRIVYLPVDVMHLTGSGSISVHNE